jgi:hypothetical protein
MNNECHHLVTSQRTRYSWNLEGMEFVVCGGAFVANKRWNPIQPARLVRSFTVGSDLSHMINDREAVCVSA